MMYGWMWEHLPGPWPVRALIAVAAFLVIVAVLFLLVFPVVDAMLLLAPQTRHALDALLAIEDLDEVDVLPSLHTMAYQP